MTPPMGADNSVLFSRKPAAYLTETKESSDVSKTELQS
jgi:hypothetical protein